MDDKRDDIFEELGQNGSKQEITSEIDNILKGDDAQKKADPVFFGNANEETEKRIKRAGTPKNRGNKSNRVIAILLAIIIAMCGFFGGMYVERTFGTSYFAEWACDTLNERAYFVTDPITVNDLAIKGIAACVPNDPYLQVYYPEDMSALQNSFTGSNTSIGMTVGSYNYFEGIYVLSIIAGSPADKAGIKVDYRIVSVDGVDYWDKHVDDLTPYILSVPDYTDVVIVFALPTYYDDGTMTHTREQTVTITVQRQEYTETVAMYFDCDSEEFAGVLDGDTAYIKLTSFMGDVEAQFDACMAKFKEKGKTKLILDLRDNGGGSDYNLAAVGDHLLKDGEGSKKVKILTQRFKDGSETSLYTDDCVYDQYGFTNVIVLVNGNTASASEALLLAMQDYGTVNKIIGTTTYGKGTGLETSYLPIANYAITYTVSYFFSPYGNTNEKIGIQPTAGYYLDYSINTNLPYTYTGDNQIMRAINSMK